LVARSQQRARATLITRFTCQYSPLDTRLGRLPSRRPKDGHAQHCPCTPVDMAERHFGLGGVLHGDAEPCAGQAAAGCPGARARTRQLTVGITLLAVRCGTPLKPSSRNGISNSSSMSLAAAAAMQPRATPCKGRATCGERMRPETYHQRSGTLSYTARCRAPVTTSRPPEPCAHGLDDKPGRRAAEPQWAMRCQGPRALCGVQGRGRGCRAPKVALPNVLLHALDELVKLLVDLRAAAGRALLPTK